MGNTKYVGFVRNIMLGRDGLTKNLLVRIFEESDCQNVESYLSTGNISFDYNKNNIYDLQAVIELKIQNLIGRKEEVFIRESTYLAKIKDSKYFNEASFKEVYERCLTFSNKKMDVSIVLPYYTKRKDVELFKISNYEAYSVTKLIAGRTSSIGKVLEKKFNLRVTTRNWNTIERILNNLNEVNYNLNF